MNADDLFDRMASELASAGAAEEGHASTRTLTFDGVPFARLTATGAQVYLPEGSPARAGALDRPVTAAADDGWVDVPIGDAAAWPPLFEQALTAVRGGVRPRS